MSVADDVLPYSVGFKRKRNRSDASVPLHLARPGFLVCAEGTLLFKGEARAQEGPLSWAAVREELSLKAGHWSELYQGQVRGCTRSASSQRLRKRLAVRRGCSWCRRPAAVCWT